ncbi:MAG: right-handed parallel beta-helix repeat-containing protein [Deltaproteobacteria bacterium]|nr:right-handed parallel beta-helix repeat-containing protein [Deltaproteobacteria bacterium]
MMLEKYFCMLFFGLFFLTTSNLPAATIYVPDNYKTIEEAVKNASSNDTIIVHEGHYTENVVITKSITIESTKGPEVSIIHASVQDEPVIKISNVNEVAITGFTVTGSLFAGIYIHNSNNGQFYNNKSENNGSGIVLISSNNNRLVNNTANSNEQYGIYLALSIGNTLEENTVSSNKDKGIFLSSSSHNNLINNKVNLNAWDGILLWSSPNNILKGNNVFRNRYGIVLSDSDSNTLTNNSTWSNIYIILPIVLIYIGIIVYLIQKNLLLLLFKD